MPNSPQVFVVWISPEHHQRLTRRGHTERFYRPLPPFAQFRTCFGVEFHDKCPGLSVSNSEVLGRVYRCAHR